MPGSPWNPSDPQYAWFDQWRQLGAGNQGGELGQGLPWNPTSGGGLSNPGPNHPTYLTPGGMPSPAGYSANPGGWLQQYQQGMQNLAGQNQEFDPNRPFNFTDYLGGGGAFISPKTGMSENLFRFLAGLGVTEHDANLASAQQHEAFLRGQVGNLTNLTNQAGEGIRQAGTESAEEMRRFAAEGAREPLQYAQGAIGSAQEGVRRSEELAGTGTQSVAAGMEQRSRNELDLARGGFMNQEGATMEGWNQFRQQEMYNQNVAIAEARTQLTGAVQNAQNALTGAYVSGANTSMNVAQLSSSLIQAAGATEINAQTVAAQLQAQGLQNAAQMQMQIPHAVPSLANLFMGLVGLGLSGTAPQQPSTFSQAAPIIGSVIGGFLGGPIGAGVGNQVGQQAGQQAGGH